MRLLPTSRVLLYSWVEKERKREREKERGLGGFLPKEKNSMAFLLYKVYISQLWRDLLTKGK